jgi:hypothetical protein
MSMNFIQKFHQHLVKNDTLKVYDNTLTLTAMCLGYLANLRGADLRRAEWSQLSMFHTDYDIAILKLEHDNTKTTRKSDYTVSSLLDISDLLGFSVIELLNALRIAQDGRTPFILGTPWLGKWVPLDSARQRYRYREAAKAMGYENWMAYGAHSPRVGVSTQASLEKVDIDLRRVHGKWAKASDMPLHYDALRHTTGAYVSSVLLQGLSGRRPEASLTKRIKKLRRDELGLV